MLVCFTVQEVVLKMASLEGPEEGELETPQDELNESELICPRFGLIQIQLSFSISFWLT